MFFIKKNTTLILVFLFIVLVVALRIPSMDVPLDTDSSANAFFARQMLRGEILYGRFHPTHHLPGIYYTFVLAFKLLGDNAEAPKLLLLPFVFFSAWFIFLAGRSFYNDLSGILGAFFFVLVSSQLYLSGMTAEMELFANLPLIATILLLLVLLKKNSVPWKFVWVGILGAICILYKIIFIAPLIASFISIFIMAWLERNQTGSGKKIFLRLTWMTLGLMLPLLFTGGYFAGKGLFQRLIFAFTLGLGYFNNNTFAGNLIFPRPFGFPLFMLGWNNTVILVLGLIGTYRLIRRAFPLKNMEYLTDFTLALWVIVSLALAGMRGGGFPHYILTVAPPLALACGIEVALAYERWKITSSENQARLGVGITIGLIIANFFFTNYDLYRSYIPYKLGLISYGDFSRNFTRFPEHNVIPIAEYIRAHTNSTDFIYVWSINVQAYYFADRVPPIDILWVPYVSATGPPERIFNENTKYIIAEKSEAYDRPQWFVDGLARNYALETVIEEQEIYRRLEP